MELLQWFGVLGLVCIVIMYACSCFEQSANYLGRNLNGGARGALIDAIGSSLPELMVTFMFVITGVPELILAGVAVTAGSAIFNAVLIPAVSILAAKDAYGNKAESFALRRPVLLRDGIYLLVVEGLLIWMLGQNMFTLGMAGILLAAYVIYAIHVIIDSNRCEDESEEYEYESLESPNKWVAALKFDFNKVFFNDKPLTAFSAWIVLAGAVTVITVACHFLAMSIEQIAYVVGIPVYFSAVVLGAAATSLPDTVLSIKSAQRGEYQDAVSNSVGSNIFDVTVSLALPISIYLLVVGGAIPLEQSEDLTVLRWFVLGVSAAVIAGLVIQANKISKITAAWLVSLYAVWIGYIIYTM